MDEGAKIHIYDPQVEDQQVITELEDPSISEKPARGKLINWIT